MTTLLLENTFDIMAILAVLFMAAHVVIGNIDNKEIETAWNKVATVATVIGCSTFFCWLMAVQIFIQA